MMGKMPKVSVVIPCYNQGKYLDETVESVLNQIYQDFEIIIVDDGSTEDFTKKLLHNYQKPKTRVIHTDNQGLASARNRGIKEAKGEYILPLDSDDKIGKEYLEEAVKILAEYPDIGIVYCEAVHFGSKDGILVLPKYSLETLLIGNIIFASAFFRKEHWEKVGGYNINMVYGWEDWDFWLSLIELGLKVYRIPKILFYYRITETSMRNKMTENEQFFMRLHAYINHKKLYKNIAELNIVHKVARLYIDTGFGFNEKQAVSQIIIGDEKRLEFDLNDFSNIRKIRFDPINDYCVLHINNISIVRDDNSSYELDDYESNAFHQEDGNFIFATNDPQIHLDFPKDKIKKIIVNLKYVAIGKESFSYLLKYKDESLMEQSQQMKANEEMINKLRSRIDSLQMRLDIEKLSYDAILKSRSWKLTAPIRWMTMADKSLKRKLKTAIYFIFNREYRLIEKSGLFDTEYYLSHYLDVKKLKANPLVHYVASGAKEKRDPNPLFDTSYYLDENPDVVESGMNPLAHYIEIGFKEGRDPNPLFDTSYYMDQNPDIEELGINPLLHYLSIGFREGRDPNPLFDTSYYLDENPDIAESEVNPLAHYMKIGFRDGINPNPFFNTSYYLDRNRDVARSKMNPLAHYLWVGAKEGRRPNQLDTLKISIITPVYNIDELFLEKCIRSVLNQIYDNWELCLIDDGSTKSHIKGILEKYTEEDPRIKIRFLKENRGVSEALNEGVSLVKGQYIGFLDHDDELTNEALYEVFKAIDEYSPDVLYSDEAIIDSRGKTIAAHFKPDFSTDLLLSHNYITHMLVINKSLFNEIGGFNSKYDGAQDYDLILKLVEKSDKIYHIPKVLYRWRKIPTSIRVNPESKYDPDNAGKIALEAALNRRKIKGKVLHGYSKFYYHVKRDLFNQPLISIIIPFRDGSEFLKKCIESILSKTDYQDIEIIGIDNNSKERETYDVISNLREADKRFACYQYNIPFNFSKINNYGADLAKGEHILFMNSDIEVINSDWIEYMLEHSQREDVGVVGPVLYYPDNTVQHAGVIIGLGGVAAHSHRYMPRDSGGHFGRLKTIQNLSAVTGACMMTKKSIFKELGGFDEYLTHAYNDIDYCLRVREKGYLIVFTPYAELYHHESISRGYENNLVKRARLEKEKEYFRNRWQAIIANGDPYYNPNLTLDKEDFSPRELKKPFSHA